MLSGDAWKLAIYRAADNAEKLGISDFEKYAKAIFEMRDKVSKTNPMNGMF